MPLLLLAAATVVAAIPSPAIAIDRIQGHRLIHAVAVATVAAAEVEAAANAIKARSASLRLLAPP